MPRRSGPRACLQENPTAQNRPILLGGCYINIREIERQHHLGAGYISRVLSGKANPTIIWFQRLAKALDMDVESLLAAIEARKREIM